VLAAA